MSKEEFEDFTEDYLPLRDDFKNELNQIVKKSKKSKLIPLQAILS